jgi:DNA-binding protein HU-beta
MNKQELIAQVASKTNQSKSTCSKIIETTFTLMGGALKRGEKVQMVNFGSWKRLRRKARMGRNPKTGQSLSIPARNVVKFSAGQELLSSIN